MMEREDQITGNDEVFWSFDKNKLVISLFVWVLLFIRRVNWAR
jgi:hypothetical protein